MTLPNPQFVAGFVARFVEEYLAKQGFSAIPST
jgi:hypothetical protein